MVAKDKGRGKGLNGASLVAGIFDGAQIASLALIAIPFLGIPLVFAVELTLSVLGLALVFLTLKTQGIDPFEGKSQNETVAAVFAMIVLELVVSPLPILSFGVWAILMAEKGGFSPKVASMALFERKFSTTVPSTGRMPAREPLTESSSRSTSTTQKARGVMPRSFDIPAARGPREGTR